MKAKKLKTVNAIQAEINRLEAKKIKIENSHTLDNTCTLIEEVLNYLDGVGKGFVAGDDYAGTRYYSSIPGVKNLRFGRDNDIIVKVTSPIGELLPNNIEVRGVTYHIVFIESKYYSETVNY